MPPIIPLNKVQGIILRGYELLEEATFVLLKSSDAAATRQWLAGLLANNQINDATKKPGDSTADNPMLRAVNIAFTWQGLHALLPPFPEGAQGFSREFLDGMVAEHRQRILGDSDDSEPRLWAWGSNEANTPHLLLMLYATNPAELKDLFDRQKAAWEAGRLVVIGEPIQSVDLVGRKEHFGFRDGIAQPFIEGVVKSAPVTENEPPVEGNILKAGEVILGYDNEYEKTHIRPLLPTTDSNTYVDFGSNGSYLVFRQLHQDVHAFWKLLYEATSKTSLSPTTFDPANAQQAAQDVQKAVRLAAKMVGRWPSGAPLMLASSMDDPKLLDEDSYGYYQNDPMGVKCPIGSHTRRSNPRDSLEPGPGTGRLTPEKSLRVTRRHRIVRRGRPYGPPLDKSMEPEKMLRLIAASLDRKDTVDRGLLFLCFNADIARQFEFIQQTWINNPKFGGLYADNDPIMGQRFLPQVNPTFKVTTPALNALAKEGFPDSLRTKLTPLLDRELPDDDTFQDELDKVLTEAEEKRWHDLLFRHTRISTSDTFTWQDQPDRQRFTKLPDFVTVRGGAYFFMPGMDALRFLAGDGTALQRVTLDVLEPPDATQLDLARETIPPEEEEEIHRLTYLLLNKVRKDYPLGQLTRRDAHAKHHGCVKAEFIVEPDLPEDLRVGVFRKSQTYQSWVRFSNQDGLDNPDIQKDIRGMAIKLMGVEGEKLLEEEKNAQTQDFILISHPVFVTRDVAEFRRLIEAMRGGILSLGWFFFNPFRLRWRSFKNLWASMKRHANPLEIRYWSVSPYQFGARAVKYSVRPQADPVSTIPATPSRDFLKEAMKQSLAKGDVLFDFLVQFQTDPIRMPIEDPGVLWPEELSPFHKVATLKLPAQTFDSPAQMEFGEHISFTPWHSLPDHRPLGGINRARKVVYRIISEFRHQMNKKPRREPTSWDI